MKKDAYNVVYSDDMKTLIDGTKCNAPIYDVPEGVETIEEKAFMSNTCIRMLTLPASCRVLGGYTFSNMDNIEYIAMDTTVIKEIPLHCFMGCKNLNYISFPSGIKNINFWAFFETGLEELDLSADFPDAIINAYAFLNSGIKKLNANKLEKCMFFNCKNLEIVTIAEGTQFIPEGCFCGCISLKRLSLPESITEIRTGAFCDSPIKTLTLPRNLHSLQGNSFMWGILEKIENHSTSFIIENDTLYDASKTTIFGCWADSVNHLLKENGIILDGAFKGNQKIKEIDLPTSFQFGHSCFEGMTSLQKVNIQTFFLSSKIFYGCTQLSEVDIGGLASIGSSAFYCCKELKSVNIEYVTGIGDHCFYGCEKLPDLSFNCIIEIGEYAFSGCNSIRHINLRSSKGYNGPLTLERYSFAGMKGLKEIDIPEGASYLNRNFDDCISLERIKLPSTIKKIAYRTLGKNLNSLIEIQVPTADLDRFKGLLNKKFHSFLTTY